MASAVVWIRNRLRSESIGKSRGEVYIDEDEGDVHADVGPLLCATRSRRDVRWGVLWSVDMRLCREVEDVKEERNAGVIKTFSSLRRYNNN